MSNELLDDLYYLNKEPQDFVYVGFGKRAIASILDTLIFYLVIIVFTIIFALVGNLFHSGLIELIQGFAGFAFMFLYIPLFEGSSYQGTPGKQIMKIKVVGIDGERISYGKALARTLAKVLSYITLFIGFIMIAFTDKKQGLHDRMVQTYVVEKNNT